MNEVPEGQEFSERLNLFHGNPVLLLSPIKEKNGSAPWTGMSNTETESDELNLDSQKLLLSVSYLISL